MKHGTDIEVQVSTGKNRQQNDEGKQTHINCMESIGSRIGMLHWNVAKQG